LFSAAPRRKLIPTLEAQDFRELVIMRSRALLLAAALILAPLGARAADLVVWWDKGFNPEEDAAVRETIAAFEQRTGKQVEIAFYPIEELPAKADAAYRAGRPPDFAFSYDLPQTFSQWAFEDRLVDLTDAIGSFADMFDATAIADVRQVDGRTGRAGLYGLPIGRSTSHIHVWKSLLERAGFTLADIPRDWDAFWSFWCGQVQPAVRRALGRDDIWGIGLPMSPPEAWIPFNQFKSAYEADYVTLDGRLVIDDPEIRQRLVEAIDSYTAIYRKGCTPPGSVAWGYRDNNEQFLAQTVVMTPNETLSAVNALKIDRPQDYYQNVATIEWPLGHTGKVFPIYGEFFVAVVFKDGAHVAAAKEFVRFLVGEGWLAHYLDFSGGRILPTLSKLLDQPFWLNPRDPHLMAAVMQIASRPTLQSYAAISGNWRHDLVEKEAVWAQAIHRVAADGISPEQAVDEAIARIKQILNE
jgi:multiple sugar transport system substrate-binding protein